MNFRSPLLASASLLLVLSSCAAPPPRSIDAAPEYDRAPTYPHWAGRPVTWSKLGDIEDWLEGRGPEQYPEYVPRAELELAEGRLALTSKEVAAVSPGVLAQRLRASEAGFKAVLARPGLAPDLEARAERGLEKIDSLRGPRATPRTPPRVAAKPDASPVGTPGLDVQPRSAWHAAPAIASHLTPAGAWSRITIHHSARGTREIGSLSAANVAATLKDIQTVHMRDEHYGDIGYHFMIDPTGRVWQGRSLEWQGAHAGGANGENNIGNIGICLLGDFNTERPDPRALESLEKLVDILSERHHIPRSRIYGHRQLRSTECPGDSLMAWVSRFAAGATH